jgi:DNA-binding transcriptional ArsR family regulator
MTEQFTAAANILKVLAHPARLAIIEALKDGPVCVTDVCDLCDLPQPSISQHLAVLRSKEVVQYYEEGKRRCYYLSESPLTDAVLSALHEDQLEQSNPADLKSVVCNGDAV